MRGAVFQRLLETILLIVIGGGAVTAIVVAVASLQWEFAHDTPIVHYAGLLIAKFGRVPYRDIVETSMPGTFAFHALAIGLFGPGDGALAVVNLGFLALILVASWLFLARIDRVLAAAFVVWYPLSYFGGGPTTMLQRDFLAILPIAVSLALLATRRPHGKWLRPFLCGAMFGLAATIKPQLALGAPIVVLADLMIDESRPGWRAGALAIGVSMLGFALPIAVALAWLGAYGALGPFLVLLFDYLPLYVRQTGEHVFLPPSERLNYIFWNTINFGWYWRSVLHAIPAVGIALWVVRGDRAKTTLIVLLAAMTALYGFLPALAGQFWNYHYFPFVFFLIMTLGLLILPLRRFAVMPKVAILCGILLASAADGTLQARLQLDRNEAQGGRVARIATALQATLKPGETVQPVDWTDGVLHAMMRLGIPTATPFFLDYQFYHDVDRPVIQAMRERFLADMAKARPTYLVEATKRPRVSGVGTTDSFPAFDRLVADGYSVIHEESDFRILKRKD